MTEKFYKKSTNLKPKEAEVSNKQVEDEDLIEADQESISDAVDCDCHKILLVDDNAFNCQVLSMMIKNFFDIEVDVVFDGFSAIDLVKEKLQHPWCKLFKIIFMDINMPEIDGFETTKRIWELVGEDVDMMKIIALTAMPWSELSDDLIDAGMTHYIQKPIDKANLQKALQLFL